MPLPWRSDEDRGGVWMSCQRRQLPGSSPDQTDPVAIAITAAMRGGLVGAIPVRLSFRDLAAVRHV